ncbi:L,D-transpeptidase family protein [Rubricoccus marinus]|nr:L,D-transpeptidase family protein [Rubricoccus marinus]
MMRTSLAVLLVLAALLILVSGCWTETPADTPEASGDMAVQSVSMIGGDELPSDEEVERDRYITRPVQLANVDTLARAEAEQANTERLADLDTTRAWSTEMQLPLGGNVEGPSVLKLQVLLDRARFSPGEIDGRWGNNTEAALVWFQKSAGMEASGVADSATVAALGRRAGRPDSLVVTYTLTAGDVEGPFEPLPEDVYEKAKLERLGYESLGEALGERFHASPALISRLNDSMTLDSLSAGDRIRVPNIMGAPRVSGEIAMIVVSGSGHYLQALSADSTILFHAPATLGAEYDPSPSGDFEVTRTARNPTWHYQPKILASVPDDQEDAVLPGGPNNAVGTVWIALSEPHYGIHGTRAPSTIGYASSAGCTRLTNWDAEHLLSMVKTGTPVQFRDITGRDASGAKTSTSRS